MCADSQQCGDCRMPSFLAITALPTKKEKKVKLYALKSLVFVALVLVGASVLDAGRPLSFGRSGAMNHNQALRLAADEFVGCGEVLFRTSSPANTILTVNIGDRIHEAKTYDSIEETRVGAWVMVFGHSPGEIAFASTGCQPASPR